MENEIKPFNPQDAIENIKVRIKAEFASLIPDDQWNILVKQSIDQFMNSSKDRYGNNQVSDLYNFTRELLRERIKDEVQKILSSSEYQLVWEDNKHKLPDFLLKAVKDNSLSFLQEVIENLVTSTIQRIR